MDSESLEELNTNYTEFRSLTEILEEKFHNLKANAGQVAAAYVTFGGIMYVQVNLSSAASQENWWIPVAFSASVSIAFWVVFITTVKDCLRVRQQQDLTLMEQERLYRKIFSIQTGERQDDAGRRQSLAKSFAVQRFQRYACVGAVYFALFSFTCLVLNGLSSVRQR